jgi:hypothetical protein
MLGMLDHPGADLRAAAASLGALLTVPHFRMIFAFLRTIVAGAFAEPAKLFG